MLGGGLETICGYLAYGVDVTWNLGLELMASNPNFRETGVQDAVYQAIVEEWGSPLQRLGAYGNVGERPAVVDGEIVNALWDLGAASTVYKNLGAREARVYEVDTKTKSLPNGGTTTLYHGGRLIDGRVQPGAFSLTPDISYARRYADERGGVVFQFEVPNSLLPIKGQDTIGTTGISAPVYQFRGVDSVRLNQFLKR